MGESSRSCQKALKDGEKSFADCSELTVDFESNLKACESDCDCNKWSSSLVKSKILDDASDCEFFSNNFCTFDSSVYYVEDEIKYWTCVGFGEDKESCDSGEVICSGLPV